MGLGSESGLWCGYGRELHSSKKVDRPTAKLVLSVLFGAVVVNSVQGQGGMPGSSIAMHGYVWPSSCAVLFEEAWTYPKGADIDTRRTLSLDSDQRITTVSLWRTSANKLNQTAIPITEDLSTSRQRILTWNGQAGVNAAMPVTYTLSYDKNNALRSCRKYYYDVNVETGRWTNVFDMVYVRLTLPKRVQYSRGIVKVGGSTTRLTSHHEGSDLVFGAWGPLPQNTSAVFMLTFQTPKTYGFEPSGPTCACSSGPINLFGVILGLLIGIGVPVLVLFSCCFGFYAWHHPRYRMFPCGTCGGTGYLAIATIPPGQMMVSVVTPGQIHPYPPPGSPVVGYPMPPPIAQPLPESYPPSNAPHTPGYPSPPYPLPPPSTAYPYPAPPPNSAYPYPVQDPQGVRPCYACQGQKAIRTGYIPCCTSFIGCCGLFCIRILKGGAPHAGVFNRR